MSAWRAHARCLVAVSLLMAAPAAAQSTRPATGPATRAAQAGDLTVAVLDFETEVAGAPRLGEQIADMLHATLSCEQGLALVDRASIGKVLREHKLDVARMSAEQAAKVGNLLGARVFVTGRAFELDNQLYITAKLMGAERNVVDGVIVKGNDGAQVGPLVLALSPKIAARARQVAGGLPAVEPEADPLPALKAQLAHRNLPKVTVSVKEPHAANPQTQPAINSAAAEITALLTHCGFAVVDGNDQELARAGIDVAVRGTASTEVAARAGSLVACLARAELSLIRPSDEKVLHSETTQAAAADVSEDLAAQAAQQKAGRGAAIRLLQYFANTLPPAADAPADP